MSVFTYVFISVGFTFALKNSSRTKLNSAIKLKSVEPKRRSKSTSDIRFIPLVGKNNKFLFLLIQNQNNFPWTWNILWLISYELHCKESFHKYKFVFDSFLSCISTDAPNVKKKAKTFNIRSTKLKMSLSCTSTLFKVLNEIYLYIVCFHRRILAT